ncbi:MAG: hypothetical protein IPO23_06465 [Flavobacterium sp.]|nr:hypothetical protein [Flavobacterium sp.]
MSRASAVNWIMISKITLVLLLISIFSAKAQTLTSSNLPIVIISTDINPKTSQPLSDCRQSKSFGFNENY